MDLNLFLLNLVLPRGLVTSPLYHISDFFSVLLDSSMHLDSFCVPLPAQKSHLFSPTYLLTLQLFIKPIAVAHLRTV